MKKKTTVLFTAAAVIAGSAMSGLANDWDSAIHAGLNLTEGDTDTVTLNVGLATTQGNPDEDEQFTSAGVDYNYGETEDQTTAENVTAGLLHRRILSGDAYGYLDGSFLFDDIAEIDARFIVGPGVGYHLFREPGTVLGVELGVAYVYEDQGGEDDSYVAWRVGQFFEKDLSENARIFEKVEYVPEFGESDNYLINGEVGIEADINDSLALRVLAKDRFDNTPALGKDENSIEVIAGLSYAL